MGVEPETNIVVYKEASRVKVCTLPINLSNYLSRSIMSQFSSYVVEWQWHNIANVSVSAKRVSYLMSHAIAINDGTLLSSF